MKKQFCIKSLVSVANQLDEMGLYKESDVLDSCLEKVAQVEGAATVYLSSINTADKFFNWLKDGYVIDWILTKFPLIKVLAKKFGYDAVKNAAKLLLDKILTKSVSDAVFEKLAATIGKAALGSSISMMVVVGSIYDVAKAELLEMPTALYKLLHDGGKAATEYLDDKSRSFTTKSNMAWAKHLEENKGKVDPFSMMGSMGNF